MPELPTEEGLELRAPLRQVRRRQVFVCEQLKGHRRPGG